MATPLKTTDVFKPQGVPTYTYVSVSNGSYEVQLADAINNRGTLCLVTGPSKTGKTTLVSNVCTSLGLKPIIVRCDGEMATVQVWKKALEQIDFSRATQVQSSKSTTSELGTEVEGKLGWQWLAALTGKVSASRAEERTEEKCREKIIAEPCAEHLIPVLKHTLHFLVLEDCLVRKHKRTESEIYQDANLSKGCSHPSKRIGLKTISPI